MAPTITANTLHRLDPSRTLTLRHAMTSDYRRRWKSVYTAARAIITPGSFQPGGLFYNTTPQAKASSFTAWLDTAVTNEVIAGGLWQRPYVRQAYIRGLKNAHSDLRRNGWEITDDPQDVAGRLAHSPAINVFCNRAEADLQKIRRDVVATAGERLRARLMGIVTNQEGDEEEQEEQESDEEWLLALLLLLLLSGRQSALSRSNAIVSTAIVGAAAEAVLNRLFELGIRTVAPVVEYQWQTAGDSRVCLRCQELAIRDNGRGPGVYSISEARGLIPQHIGCRCSWSTR